MLYTLNVAMAFAFLSSLYGDFMQVCQHSKNISFQVMLACLNHDALFLFLLVRNCQQERVIGNKCMGRSTHSKNVIFGHWLFSQLPLCRPVCE